MLKRITNSPFVQSALGRLLGLYMLLVGVTTRWTHINRAAVERLWTARSPAVICFWHGRIVLSHLGWALGKAAPAKVLISNSREGAIAAAATLTVGAGVIRGSSAKGARRKGGVEATREMLRHMAAGGAVAMAPDGPRGPRMRAQMGPIQLAKHMKAPIVTFAWATRGRKVFNSWDRFVLPAPFGTGFYIWGEPIIVDPHADAAAMEAARRRLEDELTRLTAEVDRLAGLPGIEAAPLQEATAQQATAT
jgi:lysophospholipid acyltransferase (LPLAT)-like uncharacterized protein